jgi:hypothetical protein
MDAAIAREKQLEGGSRAKKMALIEAMNPQWRDQYADFASGIGFGPTPTDETPPILPLRPRAKRESIQGPEHCRLRSPGAARCRRPWIASSQGLLAMTGWKSAHLFRGVA